MAKSLDEFVLLEPLWDKAIQLPGDISLEEKHQMMDWPPLDEMQFNAHKYLGLSLEDLWHKAASTPNSLTWPECRLIRDCFHILRLREQHVISDRTLLLFHRRPDLKAKKRQAEAAVLTPKELRALRNLDKVYYEKLKKEYDEHQAELEAERRRRPEHMPKEWVQKIIDNKRWGFILYHHQGMVGWEDFKALFDGVLAMSLFVIGSEEIQDLKEAEIVEFEPKDNIQEELDFLRQ
jgi:hypothetical protein